MENSGAGDDGGQMFGAEDDVGGSVGGTTGSACVRQWYVSSGGGLGAGAMSGVGTTGGTCRGAYSTVEGEKYSQRMSHQQRLDTVEVEERNGGSVVAQQSSQWSRLLFMRQKRGAAAEGKKKKRKERERDRKT